jgi:hypothetical protein
MAPKNQRSVTEMSIARQQLGKHIPFAVNMQTTTNELLKAAFCARSNMKLYSYIYLFIYLFILLLFIDISDNVILTLVVSVSHYTALGDFLTCLFHLLMKLFNLMNIRNTGCSPLWSLYHCLFYSSCFYKQNNAITTEVDPSPLSSRISIHVIFE